MRPLNIGDCGVKYLLCVRGGLTKYACVNLLTHKKAEAVLNGFIGIANESKRKPSKLSVNQVKKIYRSFMQN